MTLVLNEDQHMLKESARDFLTTRAPVSQLRELRDNGNSSGYSQELWNEIKEMGWPAILVPEEYGGLEFGHVGMGLILQQSGRCLAPSPLLSSSLAGVTALLKGGSDTQKQAILPNMATGDHLIALAIDDTAHHRPHVTATTALSSSNQYEITGTKVAVVDGLTATSFIVSAKVDGNDALSLFLVSANAEGVSVTPRAALDIYKLADVSLENVKVDETALLGTLNGGNDLLDTVLDAARIGQSAELLGIAEEAYDRTLDYLRQRKQFGVPIGSFQGLQHRAAQLFAELEMCKSALLFALQSLDKNAENLAETASMTKAKLCKTAHRATTEAVQMHGGIGMTDDFEIGFFLKRCQIVEALFGDENFHLDRFARSRNY